jgi:hypothetical protein
MEIRKGDVVSVEVVVDFISAGTVYCSSLGHGTGVSFPLDYDKVKLIRRHFEVGEGVIFKDPSARTKHHASIIALHEDWAWVKLPNGTAVTARVRDLEIVEAIDTPPAPIPGGNGIWVPAPADPSTVIDGLDADGMPQF